MLIAEEKWLPQYADAIAKAKIRMEEGRKNGTLLPTRESYQGAARLHTKTVEEMRENRAEAPAMPLKQISPRKTDLSFGLLAAMLFKSSPASLPESFSFA